MRIAITGSWRPAKNKKEAAKWKLRDERGFQQATRLLGAALAKLGHRLVVATDAARTADSGAVKGAASVANRARVVPLPVVDLLRKDANAFEKLAMQRPGFLNLRSAPESPTVSKLYQVQRADAVLALGGADKTLEAIIAAAASGKRVVPVGCFGGAAEQAVKIFEAMAGSWGPHVPSNDVLGPLATTWSPGCVELILCALGARSPRILIVHGRDLESRTRLANFLARYGMPYSIMALEEARGRSLPEKFEELAKVVDAAIALITPDDIGRLRRETGKGVRARARQNVWVEFGWFWGALGRPRVLLLGKEGVEMPSDLSGLIVEQFKESPAERGETILKWVESLGWPRPALAAARTRKRQALEQAR
jgi:predicted nucleotide-binding protein